MKLEPCPEGSWRIGWNPNSPASHSMCIWDVCYKLSVLGSQCWAQTCLSVCLYTSMWCTHKPRQHQPDRSHPVPQLANGIGCDIMQKTEVRTYAAASSMARWSLFQAAVALIKSQLTPQKTSEVKSPWRIIVFVDKKHFTCPASVFGGQRAEQKTKQKVHRDPVLGPHPGR